MKSEDRQYEVFPKVVRAGGHAALTIRRRFQPLVKPCRVTITAMEGKGSWRSRILPPGDPRDGCLRFSFDAEEEQEYLVQVEEIDGDRLVFLTETRVFALEEDLYARRPLRGDLHMHTTRSDGREPPAYVAAACRRIGLDFMAITDHRLYAPSREAIDALAECPCDLLVFTGEEVHPPDSTMHIIAIGGSASVNALFPTDEYRREVDAREASLGAVPAPSRRAWAACLWCLEMIRRFGGMSIFPHPSWVTHNAYNVEEPLLRLVFEDFPFDAFEVVGGYSGVHVESNALQVARYNEERAGGRRIPIVGSSDAHGCDRDEFLGWYSTIAFVETADFAGIRAAIGDLRSVAVERLPGAQPRIHGPLRLARYAHFLCREVFPLHDALAEEEGKAMIRWLDGDPDAAGLLTAWRGRSARLYDVLWG
jgi:hypothetical protein